MFFRSRWLSLLILCAVALAGAEMALWVRHRAPPPPLATGTRLEPPRQLPDFNLIDHHGRALTRPNLQGRWTLLYFGYTNCPDICPATLAILAALDRRLRADPLRPRVVFVSVDAARDTPARLAGYVPYFDPDFVGATAVDQPSIEALARKMGVAMSINRRPDGGYDVDHSGAILVVNPGGALAAILTGPFTVDALQNDLRLITADRP